MATATSICSNAVLMLGAQAINDLYTDPSDRAALASNLYASIRDSVLRSHPWNCAIARVLVPADVTAPAFDWSYQFSLPGDWLRTISVGYQGYEPDFKVEGMKILCNDAPIPLRYIYRNTVEATWDAMLIEGMTLALRAACAYPITMSQAVADSCKADFTMFMKQARAVDGTDDTPETLGDFRLLNSRFTSAVGIVPGS